MIKIYNTLTKKKQKFVPLNRKNVKFFCCGITPYDYAHIGHAKTYVQFDIIVKYLKYKKYNVFYLQNVTDIDDKIINRAKELKKLPYELANEYERSFYEDMKELKVNSINKYARATDHINEIVSQVQRLIRLGYAYRIKDGYYFDLSKFKDYGKLSGRTTLEAEDSVSRIDDNKDKRNKGDFCLWKFYKEGDPYWNTALEKGRPGWHIEDTAITEKYLGEQYDIHGGARDLIFPHHEAEIAQMESLTKKPLVKYWMHTGFLNVNYEKMSKSLGNFITIKDALKKYPVEVLRMFFVSTHYRSPINFDEKNLSQAQSNLNKIKSFLVNIEKANGKKDVSLLIKKLKQEFVTNMDDDFNTPKALAAIFTFTNKVNKLKIDKKSAKKIKELFFEINDIFNILNIEKIPKEIIKLAEERLKARNSKDFEKSDKLREKIKRLGYIVEDTSSSFVIKKSDLVY